MSALMVLEIESGFNVNDLVAALEQCSAVVQWQDENIVGEFKGSGMEFLVSVYSDLTSISAEGVSEKWNVGAKVAFHCAYSMLDESWSDLKSLMGVLDKLEVGRFVLTFQYESMYAIKDSLGYRLLNSLVAE